MTSFKNDGGDLEADPTGPVVAGCTLVPGASANSGSAVSTQARDNRSIEEPHGHAGRRADENVGMVGIDLLKFS
jgi:hypothetical protein